MYKHTLFFQTPPYHIHKALGYSRKPCLCLVKFSWTLYVHYYKWAGTIQILYNMISLLVSRGAAVNCENSQPHSLATYRREPDPDLRLAGAGADMGLDSLLHNLRFLSSLFALQLTGQSLEPGERHRHDKWVTTHTHIFAACLCVWRWMPQSMLLTQADTLLANAGHQASAANQLPATLGNKPIITHLTHLRPNTDESSRGEQREQTSVCVCVWELIICLFVSIKRHVAVRMLWDEDRAAPASTH